jgi:hypothetical protein
MGFDYECMGCGVVDVDVNQRAAGGVAGAARRPGRMSR